jgi:energy-coupling factor transporter transmembrane protein EcfT
MAIEYRKGTSLLHRMDARTKLLIFVGMTIIAVVVIDPILMGLLFLVLYLLGRNAVDKVTLNRNLRVLVVIFFTFSLFQIFFFTPKDSYFLFYMIPWKSWIPVTVQGIIRGVAVFFRFFSVVLAVHLMLYTTPPVDLALTLTKQERGKRTLQDAGITLLLGALLLVVAYLAMVDTVQRISLPPVYRLLVVAAVCLLLAYIILRLANQGLPTEMGVALMLGFATVGILSKQTEKITDAQKVRGYDVQPKNLLRRVQVLTALLLPIFLATLERSQDISIAILSRGFDYNISARTYRRQLIFKKLDYITLAILVLLIVGGIVLNYLGIGNPTEQFILSLLP